MPHPLELQVGALRGAARRLVYRRGLGWTVAATLAVALAWCLLDLGLHLSDPGLRWMGSSAVVATALASAWRWLVQPLRVPLSSVAVARRVEGRFPELGERLASAVDFLGRPDDALAGSSSLRRAVIADSTAAVESLRLADVLEPRPARRAMGAALLALSACVALLLANPAGFSVATMRLLCPWRTIAWPQQNHLRLIDPVRVLAIGQPLDVRVVDARGAALPDEAWLLVRPREADVNTPPERLPLVLVDGALFARREAVSGPLAYRAVGGDDDSMPWIEVALVKPPELLSLQVRLVPPAYTAWPAVNSPPDVRALRGTRIELVGKANKPLTSAHVRQSDGAEWALEVDAGGAGFSLSASVEKPWVVDQPARWRLLLEDADRLVGGETTEYELQPLADLPPTVHIDTPQGQLFLTPAARIPIRAVARDDLAVRDADLVVTGPPTESAASTPIRLPLFRGPETMPTVGQENSTGDLDHRDPASAEVRSRILETTWDLAALHSAAGTEWTLVIEAHDYQPALGSSQPLRVQVISSAELQSRMAERQAVVLSELTRLLELERESQARAAEVAQQWRGVGALRRQDVDHLQGSELSQRQVERGLVSPGEGVREQVRSLLADIAHNQLDAEGVAQQLTAVLEELNRLEAEPLPAARRELTAAIKASQPANERPAAGGQAEATHAPNDVAALEAGLAGAHQQQSAIVASLERLTESMRQWDNFRRFHRDLGQLRDAQQATATETSQVGQRTLGRDPSELEPQERADLDRLANRQQSLGDQLERLQQDMAQMASELAEQNPTGAATLGDALEQLARSAAAGSVREAGRSLAANRVAEAAEKQSQALDDLQETLDILANRRENELASLVRKLRQAEAELAALRDAQAGVQSRAAAAARAAPGADRQRALEQAARDERALAEESQRLARRVERLQAAQAGQSLSQAAQSLAQAGQADDSGDTDAAADAEQAAAQALADAQQALAQQRQQAEGDLAQEQLAKSDAAIRALAARQEEVLAETVRLAELERAAGQLSRAQTSSLLQLSGEQAALVEEARSLAERFDAAAAFAFALEEAGAEMQRAAALLTHRQLGLPTQGAETKAVTRLQQLLEALAEDPPRPGDAQQAEAGGAADAGGGPQGSGEPSLDVAQIKLIRLLQVELNSATQQLAQELASQPQPSASDIQQLARFTATQGRLADMVRDLAPPLDESAPQDAATPSAPEDVLDLPPDGNQLPEEGR